MNIFAHYYLLHLRPSIQDLFPNIWSMSLRISFTEDLVKNIFILTWKIVLLGREFSQYIKVHFPLCSTTIIIIDKLILSVVAISL